MLYFLTQADKHDQAVTFKIPINNVCCVTAVPAGQADTEGEAAEPGCSQGHPRPGHLPTQPRGHREEHPHTQGGDTL